jgi:exopolysaccharide biosynthesis protein
MLALLRPNSTAGLKRLFARVGMAGIWLLLSSALSMAQDAGDRPARTSEAVFALQNATWSELEKGLSLLQANTALGTRLTVLRIDPDLFSFSVIQQDRPDGERADEVLNRTGAAIAVNGGFFSIRKDDALAPVGMLMDDGVKISNPWVVTGGFVGISPEGRLKITESEKGIPEGIHEAIQSRPVLIEPGGLWAMRTNANDQERRTLLCLLKEGDAILVMISGGGLSLYEAGWLLRRPDRGGMFGCDSAIGLDGGGSTQLSVRERPELNVTGFSRVQNFLVVSHR